MAVKNLKISIHSNQIFSLSDTLNKESGIVKRTIFACLSRRRGFAIRDDRLIYVSRPGLR